MVTEATVEKGQKSACEICGKDVTTYPAPRAKHTKQCLLDHPDYVKADAAEVSQPSPVVEVVSKTPPATLGIAPQPVLDPAAKALIERATRVSEARDRMRASAPDAIATLQDTNPLDELAAYAKAEGAIPEGRHAFWADDKKLMRHANKGKIPAIMDGGMVRQDDMTLLHASDEEVANRDVLTKKQSRSRWLSKDEIADKEFEETENNRQLIATAEAHRAKLARNKVD